MRFPAFIICLTLTFSSFSQGINPEIYKKNIVVLGSLDVRAKDRPAFFGTGFLIQFHDLLFLVTAKHVIFETDNAGNVSNELKDQSVFAFFQGQGNKIKYKNMSFIQAQTGSKWITHKNKNVDIAVALFPFELADSLVVVAEDEMVTSNRLFETYQSFFVSYHPSLTTVEDLSPIFRTGTIGRVNKDNTCYLDAFAFPGNSGSPAFLTPSSFRLDSDEIYLGAGDPLAGKLIGVVGSYIPYQDIAVSRQTNKPRVIFEENSGLSHIWTVDYLLEIMNSDQMKRELRSVGLSK